jgi:hypothetical protein
MDDVRNEAMMIIAGIVIVGVSQDKMRNHVVID